MTQLEDAWVAEELRREGGGVAGELDVALENFDRGTELTSASRPLLERIADAAVSVRDNLQPQGDVPNDSTNTQRALNIATSLPIVLLGVRLRGKVNQRGHELREQRGRSGDGGNIVSLQLGWGAENHEEA